MAKKAQPADGPPSARTVVSDPVTEQSYDEGDAVTIYSASFHSGENRFAMTQAGHAPFGRDAKFTNSIHDPTKMHAEAMDVIDAVSEEYRKEHHSIKG